MVDHVNQHGAQTSTGWFHLEEIKDASTEGALTNAVKTKLLLSLLLPINGNLHLLKGKHMSVIVWD